jgi:hypothetical protein
LMVFYITKVLTSKLTDFGLAVAEDNSNIFNPIKCKVFNQAGYDFCETIAGNTIQICKRGLLQQIR